MPRRSLAAALAGAALLAVAPAGAEGTDAVAAARAAIAARTAPQTQWTGPTTGPRGVRGKRVVYLSLGENNPIGHLWGVYLEEAASRLGWKLTVLDGKGSPAAWIQGARQALALRPDAIVTSADARTMKGPLSQAAGLGIPIVGLHGSAQPGPDAEGHLFTNIVSDPEDIGRAMVEWAVADSRGTARVVLLYDGVYQISLIKRTGWQRALASCPGCALLREDNFPIADVPTRMGQRATSWVQAHGTPLYVLAVADYYFDFAIPALRTAGVAPGQVKLVGADGTTQAWNRVRNGQQYQVMTIPEPIELQSWQAVDELNRAFHGEPPSGFVQPVYVVQRSNVDAEGGDRNQFFPGNGYKRHYSRIWGVGE
jgi:ribose transport system substrate-binding protein